MLKSAEILRTQSVGLGNNRDEVDTSAQSLHNFNIKWLQSVTGWTDEIEAGMDTEIDLFLAHWLLLLEHVRLMLVIEELNDGLPRIAVVDVVAKAGCVDNSKSHWILSSATGP